jgi:hypothetical protein
MKYYIYYKADSFGDQWILDKHRWSLIETIGRRGLTPFDTHNEAEIRLREAVELYGESYVITESELVVMLL